jgi:hypothetical protein
MRYHCVSVIPSDWLRIVIFGRQFAEFRKRLRKSLHYVSWILDVVTIIVRCHCHAIGCSSVQTRTALGFRVELDRKMPGSIGDKGFRRNGDVSQINHKFAHLLK